MLFMKIKLTATEKVGFILFAIVIIPFLLVIAYLFYNPQPERNYFIDMWSEQKAEYERAQAEKNKLK